MPADLWGQPFRAQALATNYPFDDRATLETTSGLLLTPDLFVDAQVAVPGTWAVLGLVGLDIALTTVTFRVGNADLPTAASAELDLSDPAEILPLVDALGRVAGHLVLNLQAVAPLQTWPTGSYAFDPGTADFVASVVTPLPPRGLDAFQVGAALLADDVYVLGDNGVVLTAGSGGFRVDVVGDPLFRRRDCLAAGGFTTPSFLRSVNGLGPDARGGFVLVATAAARGSTILRIDPAGDDAIAVSAAGAKA